MTFHRLFGFGLVPFAINRIFHIHFDAPKLLNSTSLYSVIQSFMSCSDIFLFYNHPSVARRSTFNV